MRKFITKMQELSKKAAELQQTVQGMPQKAAELRQAVVMSASELHQIRVDVHSTLNGLRANTEDSLLQAMREINDQTETFEEAGYELTGMDLDLAITQRLKVQFKKFDDVSHTQLRTLTAQQTKEVTRAILNGIIKAEETAANVELTHLKYDGLIVDIGAVPMIRMSWRSDTFVDEQLAVQSVAGVSTPPPIPTSAPATGSNLNPATAFGSFFEPRKTTSPAQVITALPTFPAEVVAPAASLPTSPTPSIVSSATDWKKGALDRFKKMPDLTKSQH